VRSTDSGTVIAQIDYATFDVRVAEADGYSYE
jgi:hypothetical protein